jgi:hypothetical protein
MIPKEERAKGYRLTHAHSTPDASSVAQWVTNHEPQ